MACENVQAAEDALLASLSTPAMVQGDAGTVQSRSISDLIAARNYLAAVCAASQGRSGLRFSRLIPDGTVQRRWRDRWRGE